MPAAINLSNIAVYALTEPGLELGRLIARELKAKLFLPARLKSDPPEKNTCYFCTISSALNESFNIYSGHIIIAATGLVVRVLASLIKSKISDPAVVCLGQDGRYIISLLSGHLGGANELATKVAAITGGQAVINTATDIEDQPALECLARELGIMIEDFGKLPAISRVLAERGQVRLYDPDNFLRPHLEKWNSFLDINDHKTLEESSPTVWVDYHLKVPPQALILRPPALALGLGCHRGITREELEELVLKVLEENNLTLKSVHYLATVENRSQEPALLELAQKWNHHLLIFTRDELSRVNTPNPSETVLKRIGVSSVCEAAAILAAKGGQLLIPKQKNSRATCALALIDWISSAWVLEEPRD